MKIKELKLGNIKVKNNVFLAPMAGYTDYCFRHLANKLNVGYTFTELVSAKGLCFNSEGSKELIYCGEDKNTAVQLFGSDAFFMRSACELDCLKDVDVIDINMGCPVPKVYKNGEGSALLNDIHKSEKIVKECVKSGKNITVKIRTGQKAGDDVAEDFAKMVENAGGCLVTIHGRVRENYYSGEPDYNAIYKAKKSVKIPVIANGGIFTEEDADKMIERTGVDGVMLGRGAIANPFLISKLLGEEVKFTLKEFIKMHVELMKKHYEEHRVVNEFKKFVAYYLKGKTDVKSIKMSYYQATNVKEILDITDNSFE